ncbi:hypothetical protein K0M31_012117 [Melipona bicolor]|uniref:Uncharacterized protein n=1 Tax=Melipona bicolor TaxID=60889 RepID=A0AA40KVF9_9HYME|nr:hypothetical protein K0M31_012117 [Melipona bicolor]
METGWRVHNGRQGYVGALRILTQDQPRRIEKLGKDTVRMFLYTHARNRKPSRAKKGRKGITLVYVLVHLLPVLSNMNMQTRFLEAPRVLKSRSEREGPRESHFEAGTIARSSNSEEQGEETLWM